MNRKTNEKNKKSETICAPKNAIVAITILPSVCSMAHCLIVVLISAVSPSVSTTLTDPFNAKQQQQQPQR